MQPTLEPATVTPVEGEFKEATNNISDRRRSKRIWQPSNKFLRNQELQFTTESRKRKAEASKPSSEKKKFPENIDYRTPEMKENDRFFCDQLQMVVKDTVKEMRRKRWEESMKTEPLFFVEM